MMPIASARRGKAHSKKTVDPAVKSWTDGNWKVVFGELKRMPGRPGKTRSIFSALAEKIPKGALAHVERAVKTKGVGTEGVYIAHDSMGCARYAGRGQIFKRLGSHFKAHLNELVYFSFYIIADKKHEREVETALIRVASHLLLFNSRKKRDDIEPGDVRDYEPGTFFTERQRRRGRRAAA